MISFIVNRFVPKKVINCRECAVLCAFVGTSFITDPSLLVVLITILIDQIKFNRESILALTQFSPFPLDGRRVSVSLLLFCSFRRYFLFGFVRQAFSSGVCGDDKARLLASFIHR